MAHRKDAILAIGAAMAACIVLLIVFLRPGTPRHQREIEADERRIEDLRRIAREIGEQGGAAAARRPKDPLTGIPYEYSPKAGSSYELCAVFSTDNREDPDGPASPSFWKHPKGRHCIQLDAARRVP